MTIRSPENKSFVFASPQSEDERAYIARKANQTPDHRNDATLAMGYSGLAKELRKRDAKDQIHYLQARYDRSIFVFFFDVGVDNAHIKDLQLVQQLCKAAGVHTLVFKVDDIQNLIIPKKVHKVTKRHYSGSDF